MAIPWSNLDEGVLLALDQIRVNKFRSILTILGIVIGVATVMAMTAIVGGIRSSIVASVEAAGPKNFIVARFDWNEVRLVSDGHAPPWGDNPPIAVAEVERIASLDKVSAAIADVDLTGTFAVAGKEVENVQLGGEGAGWEQFTRVRFTSGQNFTEADVRGSRPVVVISKPLAESLFGRLDPVGRRVRIDGQPFTVIGVFELVENIFASVVKNIGLIPYTAAFKHLKADDEWLGILVVTAPAATQAEAMDQVTGSLRTWRRIRPGDDNNFALIRQEEMLRTFNRVTGVFFLVMIALSSVALLVGGVGVVAIMMIAVTERTREIGVRKALGATPTEILWQFLVEAATLTVVGAAIGLLIGGLGAFLITVLTPIPAYVPIAAIVAALLAAAISGILFGIWPAWRAARLDPVAALRYE